MNYLDPLLRWGSQALLLTLLILLIRRKQHHKFSWFAIYIVVDHLTFIVRFAVRNNAWAYYIAYWSSHAIFAALLLLAIRQIFHRVLEVEYRLFRWMRFVVPATFVLILGFATYEGIQALGRNDKITAMINGFDIGVHAFQASLLFLLVALRLLFPARWLRYEFGILTGLALYSIVNVCTDLLWLEYGRRYGWVYSYGPPIAFMVTALIWLWVFSAPAKAIAKKSPRREEFHHPMDREQPSFIRFGQ
jgi:heme/copper-type cytochrome/quinol oxidase subunit 2